MSADTAARRTAGFSLARIWAIAPKEFVQMRRDRLTFAMIVGVPILQVVLFGYAINIGPEVASDRGRRLRSQRILAQPPRRACATPAISRSMRRPHRSREPTSCSPGATSSSRSSIPAGFSSALLRGERPALLLVEPTPPTRPPPATRSHRFPRLAQTALSHDLTGPLAPARVVAGPVHVDIQRRYNAEGITQYNIVPGLVGVILQMTMVMMTAFAVTRERERGTYREPPRHARAPAGGDDRARSCPTSPSAWSRSSSSWPLARVLFDVPMIGSLPLLVAAMMLYHRGAAGAGFRDLDRRFAISCRRCR